MYVASTRGQVAAFMISVMHIDDGTVLLRGNVAGGADDHF
jgi:hypothetical protein